MKEHSFGVRECFFHWFNRKLNRAQLKIHASFVHLQLFAFADSNIFIEPYIDSNIKHVNR